MGAPLPLTRARAETVSLADGGRENNFGLLRLLFAALVVVEHSPELIDGNRAREPLTQLFGTMATGEVAVDGFFLISGFLITKSFIEGRSLRSFLTKRCLRIFPAFLVSFWICILVVAPFAGGAASLLSAATLGEQLARSICMLPPEVSGIFEGLPYPHLNGATWTIAYEFRCYILTALLGLFGVFKPRYRWLVLAGVMLLVMVNASGAAAELPTFGGFLLGTPHDTTRFTSVFGVGALFYLFRDKVKLTHAGAAAAAGLLFATLFSRHLAEAGVALFGGYLVFWFAFRVPVLRISRFDNAVDVSYGLYLYAWPVQMLIIWNDPHITPWALTSLSLLVATILGYASWTFIEKPALAVRRGR